METVEVLVRIPKENYDYMIANSTRYNVCDDETLLYNYIKEGTVLPRGHGRLIDENTIAYTDEEFADGRTYMVVHPCDIEDAPTVIEADKENYTDGNS